MERDAAHPLSPADAVPPHPPDSVRLIGLVGAGLCAVAAILAGVSLGLDGTALRALDIARVVLVFIGAVTAGAAISMRPDLWWAWGLGSVAAGLGVVGLPASWDSFHMLFRVFSALAAVGAVLCVSGWGVRVAVSAAAIMFHFTGIFMAATSPPPRPWINEQAFTRVFNPYLQFIYMRNAYQFYSPNPGPASVLVFLLKTENGKDELGRTKYTTQWVVMPRRPADIRDPLGLSYYRRLSLTQQISVGNAGLVIPTDVAEKHDVIERREARSGNKPGDIPYHPIGGPATQYAVPNPEVQRFVLPSYASHVIMEHQYEAAARTTVKVYRLDHQTTPVEQFITKLPGGYPSPYHPGTYRPFFLGEFDVHGRLVNPQEEFLYWLIPIIPRFPAPGDPLQKPYVDYLSAHALNMTAEDVLKADEKDGRVFNWSQLKWSETR